MGSGDNHSSAKNQRGSDKGSSSHHTVSARQDKHLIPKKKTRTSVGAQAWSSSRRSLSVVPTHISEDAADIPRAFDAPPFNKSVDISTYLLQIAAWIPEDQAHHNPQTVQQNPHNDQQLPICQFHRSMLERVDGTPEAGSNMSPVARWLEEDGVYGGGLGLQVGLQVHGSCTCAAMQDRV